MSEDPAPVWDAELEVCLFQSMQGHKPVGFNKHFHMICIQHKYVNEEFESFFLGWFAHCALLKFQVISNFARGQSLH